MRFSGIAIAGKSRAGKDAAAKAICEADPHAYRFAFADSLKWRAARFVGHSDDFFFAEHNKIEHRKFLIAMGTAVRVFSPDFWIDTLSDEIRRIRRFYVPEVRIPVISDMRYTNESRRMRDAGYMLVRINCPDEIRLARGGFIIDDESETGLDAWTDWDLVLDSSHLDPQAIAKTILTAWREAEETSDRNAMNGG